MVHKKIRFPKENANEILLALGKTKNAIEFEDLTKNDYEAKKNFGEMIKRCDEMKKKISDFNTVCSKFKIPFNNNFSFQEINAQLEEDMKERDKKLGSTYFDLIENEILENDKKINELVNSHSQLKEDLINIIEKKYVMLKISELVRNNMVYQSFGDSESDDDGIKINTSTNLVLIAGTIPVENELKMKRMIFRISRGNAVTAFYSLEINKDEYLLTSTVRKRRYSYVEDEENVLIEKDDNLNESILSNQKIGTINTKKKIFSIVFPGGEENILLKKILKVCEIFQASRFNVPATALIQEEVASLVKDINEKRNMLMSIENNLKYLMADKNNFKGRKGFRYSLYKLFFEQQRLIYINLGKCILRENFIDGRVWIPKNKLAEVQVLLSNLFSNQEDKTSAHLEDIELDVDNKPPTFILTNEFTYIPQLIVDTYGIPRYQEINPGYFTIITFPFLFGVMFGDIGHGLFLLILSIYLIINNNKLSSNNDKSIFHLLSSARYFLLLMACFALFCGLLYNDFLSVPIYFKSCYPKIGDSGEYLKKDKNCNYSFGLDPVWTISTNELMFVNSLKMKFSVIFGVFQMTLGIILNGLNFIYEKNYLEYLCVFIPQLIFMLILFGYMDFLIFIKWSIDYEGKENQAPDIKSYLMNIFLKFGELPQKPEENKEWILLGSRGFTEKVHLSIFILSIICLLVMLIPRIFFSYLKAHEKFRLKRLITLNNALKENMNENLLQSEDNDNNDNREPLISDFIVASVIETIEFALGSISNTASYLRLWALSLAHGQLSAVFFSYSIGMASMITDYFFLNGFLLSFVYIIFAIITFGVLLCIDLMECFLHTLRLHWVEFQNKFFHADGYKFQPFCFELNIDLNNEEF